MGNGTLYSYQSKFLAYLRKVSELQAFQMHYQIAQPVIVRLERDERFESEDSISLVEDSRLTEASRILVRHYGLDPDRPETLPEAVQKLKKRVKTYETCCDAAFRAFLTCHFNMFGGHKAAIYQFDPDATAEENLRKMHSLLCSSICYGSPKEVSRLDFYIEKLQSYAYCTDYAPTPMWLETEYRRASRAVFAYLVADSAEPVTSPASER